MNSTVVALNHQVHAHTRLQASRDFSEFASQHLFPVTLFEFVRAASEFPLVFVKDSDSGQFRSVALTGLQTGENLYQQLQQAPVYLPLAVQNYPLVLIARDEQPDQFQLGVNTGSVLLSTQQGEPLFSGTEQSPFLQHRTQKLLDTLEQTQISNAILQLLAERQLLKPQAFRFEIVGDVIELGGIYILDEKAFSELSADDFADLRQRGVLPALYAHLASLHQLNRLASMKVALKQQGA